MSACPCLAVPVAAGALSGSAGYTTLNDLLAEQLRQLGDVRGGPPRLIVGVASPCALSAPIWETDFYVKN
jgi:hypothetical protein